MWIPYKFQSTKELILKKYLKMKLLLSRSTTDDYIQSDNVISDGTIPWDTFQQAELVPSRNIAVLVF